jgi:hypothetical protein
MGSRPRRPKQILTVRKERQKYRKSNKGKYEMALEKAVKFSQERLCDDNDDDDDDDDDDNLKVFHQLQPQQHLTEYKRVDYI